MPVLPRLEKPLTGEKTRQFFIEKLGPIEYSLKRIDVLNWINSLMAGSGGCLIGRIQGHRDQWLIGAHYRESSGTIIFSFCQGRSTGRINQNGGYLVKLFVLDCEDEEDISFKFKLFGTTQREEREIRKELRHKIWNAVRDKDEALFRRCVRHVYWAFGHDEAEQLPELKGEDKMSEAEIMKMRENVDIALKNGATPSLKICEELRAVGPTEAKWLDDTYLKYKRPELVGDDKDGLCAILKSEGYLRKAIEKCKMEEVVYWMRIIKGLDPLPDSLRETLKQEADGEDE